ncbi:MAG TPA: 50S ribosomal protein L30 [Armatimonadetes bacterium]|jgi:large subunit ribosomal protein L30|nr:50S ribosomal protein L30 [Armatimonadota bacterium]
MVVDQQIKVTLVRSVIGNTERQRASARSLGLTRVNKSVVHPDRPEIRGMIRAIQHLVRVESVAPAEGAAEAQSAPEATAAKTEGANE